MTNPEDRIKREAESTIDRVEDALEIDEALRILNRVPISDPHIWYLAEALEAGMAFLAQDAAIGDTDGDFSERLKAAYTLTRHIVRYLSDAGEEDDYQAQLEDSQDAP